MTDTGSARPPGAVLFDIDGTLVDSNYVHVDAWLRAAAEQLGAQAQQRHSERYRQTADLLRTFDGALLSELDTSPLAGTWS